MAARRGKSQARRSGAAKRSGLMWLAAGLAIGGLVFGYLHFKDDWKQPLDSLLPRPDPNAQAHPPSSEDAVVDVPEKPRTKFDFYKLLPEKEVVIPDAELDAQARAEAAQAAAAKAAQEAQARSGEQPPADSPSLDVEPRTPPGAATAGSPATPAAPVGTAAADGNHYVIQAGAFLGNNEAEALKAKIALTGEVARVEVAEINGKSVHRVRMGPYPNASALAAAKAALAAHGIEAQAIRVK